MGLWSMILDRALLNIKNNNKGFTMLEIVITMALVTIFFGVVVVVVPSGLSQYISMMKLSDGIELTNVIENGIAGEFAVASSIYFDEENDVITYIKDHEQRSFPSNDDDYVAIDDNDVTKLNEVSRECTSYTDANSNIINQITAGGRPYVFNTICDDGVYDGYYSKIKITYNQKHCTYEIEVEVYDENYDIICSSKKPIITYNN